MTNPHRLLAVRHGQTEWNIARRIQGDLDAPLTAEGIRQARNLGALIRREGVDQIRVSPAPRARRTADIAVEASGCAVTVVVDELLREMELTPWQGLTFAEVARRYPGESEAFWTRPDEFEAPTVETFHALFARARKAMLAAVSAEAAPTAPVLLVTHSLTIKAAALAVTGQSPTVMWSTAEIGSDTLTELRLDGSRWLITNWARSISEAELHR